MGRKKDEHEHPVDRKIGAIARAIQEGDEEALAAEADELPKDENGMYIIP